MPATTAFRDASPVRPLATLAAVATFILSVIKDAVTLRTRLVKRYGTYE